MSGTVTEKIIHDTTLNMLDFRLFILLDCF
jgi:hypothetical protein